MKTYALFRLPSLLFLLSSVRLKTNFNSAAGTLQNSTNKSFMVRFEGTHVRYDSLMIKSILIGGLTYCLTSDELVSEATATPRCR